MSRTIRFAWLAGAVMAGAVLWTGTEGRAAGQASGPATLRRPAYGFSVGVPAGWREHVDPEVPAAMEPQGRTDVAVMVFVRERDETIDVGSTVSAIFTEMTAPAGRRVVSRSTETFLGRTALVGAFDDDSSRYRLTIFPRDAGPRSRMYYLFMAIAPINDAAMLRPAFDSIRSSLQIIDVAGGPVGQSASPGSTANQTATRTFTMDRVPFSGEIPADWGGRKNEAGTFIFEGPKGTEAYEVSIELGFELKRAGYSIGDVADEVQTVLRKKTQARIQPTERQTANDGTPVRLIRGTYTLPGNGGAPVLIRHLTAVTDFPGYYVLMSYFTPDPIYEKYRPVFNLFAQKFRYTGR